MSETRSRHGQFIADSTLRETAARRPSRRFLAELGHRDTVPFMDTAAPTYRCPQFRDLVDRYRSQLQAGVSASDDKRQLVEFERISPPLPD